MVLDGLQVEQGHVRATDLEKELRLLLSVLSKTENELLGQRDTEIYYLVVDLRHSSPSTVVLEARSLRQDQDRRADVFKALKGFVHQVESGSLDRLVETSLLRDIRDMAAPVTKTLAAVTILFDDTTMKIDQGLRKTIDQIIAPEEVFNGTMTGMLEAINVHADANRFWIYPGVGPTKVKCKFPPELRKKAIEAVGHYVKVQGAIKYKTTAPYPHEISVSDLVDLPQDNLPSFDDLRGTLTLEKGISSEEFVRKIRDAL